MSFRILGDISNLSGEYDIGYFKTRDMFIDLRDKIHIGQNVCMGFGIKIITQSHDMYDWKNITSKPVTIGKDAFIGSFALLYNCKIGEGAVVACGAVVRRDVEPYTMVEGNPAKVIKRKIDGKWVKCG